MKEYACNYKIKQTKTYSKGKKTKNKKQNKNKKQITKTQKNVSFASTI
jgi:hypothetical protein